jgi:hypothetical protein
MMDDILKVPERRFINIDELGNSAPLEGKVECISDFENNWGSCDPIKGNLEVGKVYTVDRIEVHSWHTKVYLKEMPGKVFNSVHFEKVNVDE